VHDWSSTWLTSSDAEVAASAPLPCAAGVVREMP